MKTLSLLIVVIALASTSWAFYEKNKVVTALTAQNFAHNVIASSKVWVVEFYAPWCGHCKTFAPEFLKAAENLKGIVHFGAVDCDNKENQPICGHFKVEGFPTVKLFKADPEAREVEGKQALMKDPIDYQGQRSAGALAHWALTFLPDKVGTLTDPQLEEYTTLPVSKALLFSDKDTHSHLLKALALDFDERAALMQEKRKFMTIAQANKQQKKAVSQFGITRFPTLLVLDAQGSPTLYEGEMKYEPMYKFLESHANEMTEQRRREAFEAGKKAQERAKGANTPSPTPATPPRLWHVDTPESYDEACRQLGVCLIAFLDTESPDHQSYLSTLESLVSLPKYSAIRILWVDGVKHESFKKAFDTADGYPQAVAFQRKSLRVRYLRSAFEESLLSEFLDMVQGGKGRTATLDKEPRFQSSKDKEEL